MNLNLRGGKWRGSKSKEGLRNRVLTPAKDYTERDRAEGGRNRAHRERVEAIPRAGGGGRSVCDGMAFVCLAVWGDSSKTQAAPLEAKCFQDLTSRMFSSHFSSLLYAGL